MVEDESNILTIMRAILSANDYKVIEARDGKQALQMVASHCPDLVLLDLGLPDMDGLGIIRQVRAWSKMPIVVVSARDRERDKVEALDLGADDYITKPFGTSELLARIRAALRHMQGGKRPGLRPVRLRRADHRFLQAPHLCGRGGGPSHPERIQDRHLAGQVRRPVLTYDFIIQHVWGPHAQRDNQILRVNMANIRRKLEKNPASPAYLSTEIGVGYRMAEADGPRL